MIALSDLDWNKVLDEIEKDPGLKALEAGTYTAVVESAEATHAQSSGAPMIKLTLRVTVGAREGAKVFSNIVLAGKPKAMMFTKRKLAGLGIDDEYLRKHNPGREAIAKAITGVTTIIEVTNRETEEWGTQADVKTFKQPGGVVSAPTVGKPGPTIPKPGASAPSIPKPPSVPTPAPEPEPEPEVAPEPEPEPEAAPEPTPDETPEPF